MKLTTLFLLAATLQVAASADAQQVSIRGKNLTLKSIFKAIRNQTGYVAIYEEQLIEKAKPVTLEEKTLDLKTLLDKCFANQSLTYTIREQAIIVKAKEEKKELAAGEAAINNALPEKPAPPPTIDIRGIVKNERGEPVEGATVAVKGSTTKRTSTNAQGEFSLSGVDDKATLVISAVTIETLEVAVKNRVFIAIDVVNKVNDLDETVVVAYNTSTKRSNVGAVTVVKGEQIQNLPNRSFDKSLQGLVPGLLVTSGNGQPGSAPVNFLLRGIATGGQPTRGETFRNPLIVIDGVPVSQDPPDLLTGGNLSGGASNFNPMAQFNPNDIETISVLKDASAVALYGSKASNGVILVTTKTGKAGKTKFTFSHNMEIASRIDGASMLNQTEYLELLYEAYRNSTPGITDDQIKTDLQARFPFRSDGTWHPNPDWTGSMFNRTAVTNSSNLSMSGGNTNSNFYLNLEYTKQDGVARQSGFDRKSIRFNFENRPTSWLKLGINSTLSYNVQKFNSQTSFYSLATMSPLNPIYKESGEFIFNYTEGARPFQGGDLYPNPISELELNINRNVAYRALNKAYVEARFLRYFTWSSALGADFAVNEIKEKIHPLLAIDGNLTRNGRLSQLNTRTANIISTNSLRFNKQISNDHSLNLLLAQEAQILTSKNTQVIRSNFITNPLQDQLVDGDILQGRDADGKQNLLSYFGQANYGLKNRYFLSASVRSDGSSAFGINERFGTFWSLGASWIVSDESFLKKRLSWLNYLKLRGSYGPSGNSSAIRQGMLYDALNRYGLNAIVQDYFRNPGNPSLKWEKTSSWNAGVEMKFLNGRLGLIIDIYNRTTVNLIDNNIPLGLSSGFRTFSTNIGDIRNRGLEFTLNSNIVERKDFQWSFSGSWSRNTNTLLRAAVELKGVTGSNLVNTVGQEYNSFYLAEWAGVNPISGRPMWIDSTGKANENYNAAKRKIVGKAQPDGFGSVTNIIRWKSVEFAATLFFQYGSDVYFDGGGLQNDGRSPYINQMRNALDRWQKPGDVASNPRRLLNGQTGSVTDQGNNSSTRYLFDGDFIRLSNLSLTYNLPDNILSRIKLNSARIFLQGHNLLTWTHYSGQDPENVSFTGNGSFFYPQQRTFTFGLSVGF